MNATSADAEYLLKFLDGGPGLPEHPSQLGSLSEELSVLLLVCAESLDDRLRFSEEAGFGFRALNN
ncbi:hypothetical protein [Streptomyces albus]|uniref:hypothetical protein n=1 Tax=Streptomyces albus TaxID=1888 RepID=UPI0006E1C579|nr:hypothetical protein [Streptomyces albus]